MLVADSVQRNGWTGIRAQSDRARELSRLLSTGQLRPGEELPPDFRSPNSVQRKSYDIATQHPNYEGKPTRGNRLDALVLTRFLEDPHGMHARALLIEAELRSGRSVISDAPDLDLMAFEGALLPSAHLRRERNPALRRAKLAEVARDGRAIACEACGFDFAIAYGARGEGYIEVHHVRPLHDSGETQTRLSDLALLCANCHRMCHRTPWVTPDELRDSHLQQ